MKNPDLNEILGEGPGEADEKMKRMMPGRPDRMSDHSESETVHTKEDIQLELDRFKDYEDVTKKPDGMAAIKLAQKTNPSGLDSGRPVNVEYKNHYYKVIYFNLGEIETVGNQIRIKKTGKKWVALKGEKIEED